MNIKSINIPILITNGHYDGFIIIRVGHKSFKLFLQPSQQNFIIHSHSDILTQISYTRRNPTKTSSIHLSLSIPNPIAIQNFIPTSSSSSLSIPPLPIPSTPHSQQSHERHDKTLLKPPELTRTNREQRRPVHHWRSKVPCL